MLLSLLQVFLLGLPAQAQFSLSTGLNQGNRQAILKTLGLGTLSKSVTQAAPLGSDPGLEFSIATEIIDTKKIAPYIVDESDKEQIYYPKIIMGKGIYSRVDLFFHLTPYTQALSLSEYGMLVRYNFYRSDESPLLASLVLNGSTANFNNQLISNNLGADILLGMNLGSFSVSTSFGIAQSKGEFLGGAQGITDTLIDENELVKSPHYAIFVNWRKNLLSLGLGMDHYTQPTYTFKLGLQL